ncbi:hypothetical protein [Noviherbaspirillum massiliense]|uniref:hypothetical protein n=1 Tax=Noviherbaspirillum massiliense TaxID=1465823 RepID=UPI0003788770|nr:hypothetical protein [Noviherbaspirillum massiliense]
MSVLADKVETGIQFSGAHEVTAIQYAGGRLTINVNALDGTAAVTVTFSEIAGFRVLDEGDLLEFWEVCGKKDDWIFHVKQGGWFDLEAQRTGFVRGDIKAIKEYLITGTDDCVSVLAWGAPEVSGYAV